MLRNLLRKSKQSKAKYQNILTLHSSGNVLTNVFIYFTIEECMKLRQVNTAFDHAVFKTMNIFAFEADQVIYRTEYEIEKVKRSVKLFKTEREEQIKYMEMRIEKYWWKINSTKATYEWKSYGSPPEYVFKILEAIGEMFAFIKSRVKTPELHLPVSERWNEVRKMVQEPNIIINLSMVDVDSLPEERLFAIKMLSAEDQKQIAEAKRVRSACYNLYQYAILR